MHQNGNAARLSPEDKRRALILAIASRPDAWIARELSETLAREEYRRGHRDGMRRGIGGGPSVQ